MLTGMAANKTFFGEKFVIDFEVIMTYIFNKDMQVESKR